MAMKRYVLGQDNDGNDSTGAKRRVQTSRRFLGVMPADNNNDNNNNYNAVNTQGFVWKFFYALYINFRSFTTTTIRITATAGLI